MFDWVLNTPLVLPSMSIVSSILQQILEYRKYRKRESMGILGDTGTTQQTFTCSKSLIETEKGVKYFQN